MDSKQYVEKILNNDFELFENNKLEKIMFDEYEGKTILDYLLEKGYHNAWMDNLATYKIKWAKCYLKHNILSPLMECFLDILFTKIDDKIFIDHLLDKLNPTEKLELYYNIQKYNYWKFHTKEVEIINIFKKHNVDLPKIFFKDTYYKNPNLNITNDLFKEFLNVFSNEDEEIIKFILKIFKNNYRINPQRTTNDMLKLMDYKKNNPDFRIIDSYTPEGEYNAIEKRLETNKYVDMVFNHELSHILFEVYESDSRDEAVNQFNTFLNRFDYIDELDSKIAIYLNDYHIKYEKAKIMYRNKYRKELVKKYGSFDNYVKQIY